MESAAGRHSRSFLGGRRSGLETRTAALESPSLGIPGVPDGVVILILGNIYGLNDAPQRWWKKFDAVMTSIGFSRSTFDVCVYTLRSTAGNLEGTTCPAAWQSGSRGAGRVSGEVASVPVGRRAPRAPLPPCCLVTISSTNQRRGLQQRLAACVATTNAGVAPRRRRALGRLQLRVQPSQRSYPHGIPQKRSTHDTRQRVLVQNGRWWWWWGRDT